MQEYFNRVTNMLVVLIDVVSVVQEVVLQDFEQIFGKVGPGFVGAAMCTDLCQAFFDDRFVAGITEMDGTLLKPCCWPTDRMYEPASMGMVAPVLAAVIVFLSDLSQERIDNLFSYSGAGMDVLFCHQRSLFEFSQGMQCRACSKWVVLMRA